jgi:beta-N-acetylhexosaminidase
MVSHVTVPARDAENPSSLSRAVMTDWLRGELGFRGIIIADDFSMAAVASRGIAPEDAAVEALIAGADMVMTWPSAIVPVHRAIAAALADGRLPRQRLLEAVERIAAEKLRYGLVRFDGEDDEAHDNN